MKGAGIYKIENTITNQIYIGSTKNLNKRKNEHFAALRGNRHCNIKLQRSVNKYGIDVFIFEIIEMVDPCTVIQREQHWLDLLKPQLNICLVANSVKGIPRTKEWADKISKSNKGKKMSEESKVKMSLAKVGKTPPNKGIPHSPATKFKISQSKLGTISWNKGIPLSESHKANARNARLGYRHSVESREKISIANVGKHSKPLKKLFNESNCNNK